MSEHTEAVILRRAPECRSKIHVKVCNACGHLLTSHTAPVVTRPNGPWVCGCGCEWSPPDPTTALCSVAGESCAVIEDFDPWRPTVNGRTGAP